MKKRILLKLSAVALLAVSCSESVMDTPEAVTGQSGKLILSQNEYASIYTPASREISADEAIGIARSFAGQTEPRKYARNGSTRSVADKFYFQVPGKATKGVGGTTQDSIPLYKVQMGSAGIAIVSGDERAPKVLAYLPDASEKSELNEYMLDLSKTSLLMDINRTDSLREALHTPTLEKIAEFAGQEKLSETDLVRLQDEIVIEGKVQTRSQPVDMPTTTILAQVGNYGHTQWDQEAPYNNKLPLGDAGFIGVTNYPAGCAVVAVAQALACTFVQPAQTLAGVDLDWEYLTENPTMTSELQGEPKRRIDMVGELFKDIYDNTKSQPVYELIGGKEIVVSSVAKDKDILAYLKEIVQCSTLKNMEFNSEKLKYSLDDLSVALVFGTNETKKEGHVWVIDGYLICKKGSRELVRVYDVYYHALMGWSKTGGNDGYYLVNSDTKMDFETSYGTYPHSTLEMIFNIRNR